MKQYENGKAYLDTIKEELGVSQCFRQLTIIEENKSFIKNANCVPNIPIPIRATNQIRLNFKELLKNKDKVCSVEDLAQQQRGLPIDPHPDQKMNCAGVAQKGFGQSVIRRQINAPKL